MLLRVGLLRDRDFRSLWAAATVSGVGTELSGIALPLLVIELLHASTFQVGVLTAAETAAFLIVGLPAGAVVDRVRRRRVLVIADLSRALLLASVPAAWFLDVLTFTHVVVVALMAGLCTVFFDVAYQSHLPDLVGRTHLVEANASLEISMSSGAVVGPAAGGIVVQLLTAPWAIGGDAASYLWSALLIGRIQRSEPDPAAPAQQRMLAQIKEGLAYVVRHPLLRAIATCTGIFNFFAAITQAVLIVFLVRTLQLPAGTIGVLFSISAIGGLVGAATVRRFSDRVGHVRSIWLGPLATMPFFLLLPLAQRGPLLGLVAVAQFIGVIGVVYYNVGQVSLRQVMTPDHLLGRMNASMRFLVWGPRPLGALAGGVLGQLIGLRPTLWVAVVATQLSLLPLVFSPLRRMRDAPAWGPTATSAAPLLK